MTAITRAKMEAATAGYSELRAEIARHLGLTADERLRLRVRPADG